VFKAAGVVSEEELLNGYRRFGQRLEGHPTPILPWVDVATGSLGQGLPDGVGGRAGRQVLERLPYRVWSCAETASSLRVHLGGVRQGLLLPAVQPDRDRRRQPARQRGETDVGWNLQEYQRRMEGFGARVLTVDGHDLAAIDQAMTSATDTAGASRR